MNRGALLLALVLSMSIVSSLSQPITVPVIVKLGNDKAINMTIATLTKDRIRPIVVEFGSLGYVLTIWRAYNSIIWIGHGLKSGIVIYDFTISWKKFSVFLRMTPGIDIILSCYSENVRRYANVLVVGYNIIDAIIAAHMVAYLITKDVSVINKLLMEIHAISTGKRAIIPLGYFGPTETKWAIINFVLIFITLAIGSWATSMLRDYVHIVIARILGTYIGQFVAFIVNLVGFFWHQVAFWELVCSAISTVTIILYALYNALPWWAIIIIGAALLAAISAAPAKISSVIQFALGFITWITGLKSDLDDNNDVASMPWDII